MSKHTSLWALMFTFSMYLPLDKRVKFKGGLLGVAVSSWRFLAFVKLSWRFKPNALFWNDNLARTLYYFEIYVHLNRPCSEVVSGLAIGQDMRAGPSVSSIPMILRYCSCLNIPSTVSRINVAHALQTASPYDFPCVHSGLHSIPHACS